MKKKKIDKIIKRINDEYIHYNGIINFASWGVGEKDTVKAFKRGVRKGVECAKVDVIRIIEEEINVN